MKVIMVGCSMAYLGSEVYEFGMIEKEVENPKFRHQYYDKVGNSHASWYLFDNQRDADEAFFLMFRKLKSQRGLKNFPKDWRERYDRVYSRAERDYPEVMV